MAYFLGREVDIFITQETAIAENSGVAQAITVTTDAATFVAEGSGVAGSCIPTMASATTVQKGIINDVTGIDLSISVSDEDVGPFLGKIFTQKIELRKELTVSFTRKKSNNFWDVIYNGPVATANYIEGDTPNAKRFGARFGGEQLDDGVTDEWKISNGTTYMPEVLESGSTTLCCYGYRMHVRLKDNTAGEIITIKNLAMTGHTVSLNADGVTEETCEFSTTIAAEMFTPTDVNTFFLTLTPISEL
tara:strand:- start:521 stop:1261 length:741 start_codon:yes stop_codon:yes gene_type:complete